MKLSLEQKTTLSILGIHASNLLVEIIDEQLPKAQRPTGRDIEFKDVLTKIHQICPLLSDSYMEMYNYIQKDKSKIRKSSYLKRFRKAD